MSKIQLETIYMLLAHQNIQPFIDLNTRSKWRCSPSFACSNSSPALIPKWYITSSSKFVIVLIKSLEYIILIFALQLVDLSYQATTLSWRISPCVKVKENFKFALAARFWQPAKRA
jgi:hypothetical protein